MRLLAPSVVAFWSDGTRYATWQTQDLSSALVVYDTLTRHRHVLTLPRGCFNQGGSFGRFVLNCGSDQRVLDLRTGSVNALPAPLGYYNPQWASVGSYYIEGAADKSACPHSTRETLLRRPCIALYDQATGAVTYRPESQVGDADRPGDPPVCLRLRSKVIDLLEEKGEGQYGEGLWAELVHVGEARPTRIRIIPCRGRATIVHALTGRNFPENLDLNGRFLTWDSGQPGTSYFEGENGGEDVEHGVLWSYDLVTRRREKWTLPRTRVVGGGPEESRRPGVLGHSDETRHAVFWLATRTLTCNKLCEVASWSVYAAVR